MEVLIMNLKGGRRLGPKQQNKNKNGGLELRENIKLN